MIRSRRAPLLIVLPILFAFSLGAQTRYALVRPETVQQRLDLNKGDDTTRERALLKLFTEAGCQSANLSEQLVPHRKQPNFICVLPGSPPEVIVVGAHFDHVSHDPGDRQNVTVTIIRRSVAPSHAAIVPSVTRISLGQIAAQWDLYKQPNGDIEIFRKGGLGEGIETGINGK